MNAAKACLLENLKSEKYPFEVKVSRNGCAILKTLSANICQAISTHQLSLVMCRRVETCRLCVCLCAWFLRVDGNNANFSCVFFLSSTFSLSPSLSINKPTSSRFVIQEQKNYFKVQPKRSWNLFGGRSDFQQINHKNLPRIISLHQASCLLYLRIFHLVETKHKFKVSVNASSSIIFFPESLFDVRHFESIFDRASKLREMLSLITE